MKTRRTLPWFFHLEEASFPGAIGFHHRSAVNFLFPFWFWSLGSSGPKFPLISNNCMCTIYKPFMVLHMSLLTTSYTSNVFLKLSLCTLKVYNTQISSCSMYFYKCPGIFWKLIYLIVALANPSYRSLSLLFQPCLCHFVSWISDPITVTPTITRLSQRDASGTFMPSMKCSLPGILFTCL